MRTFARELHASLRALARSPLFATVAILSLGIALALNTTMFALVDAILHPPDPYPARERLYHVNWRGDDPRRFVRAEDKLRATREGLTVTEGIGASAMRAAQVVVGTDGSDAIVSAVSPEYFTVVGVPPLHGRTFGPASATAHEAVIEFQMWRRAFGERPLERGLTLELDDQLFTVVGVMPPGMRMSAGEVWIPLGSLPPDTTRQGRYVTTVVRVKPEVTKAMLERELGIVAQRLQAALGSPGYPLAPIVWEIGNGGGLPRLGGFYKLLLVVVGGVLAIACANLATLLMARGAARRREMAVRLAMGASRWRVGRQVLLECGTIAAGGAAVGMLLTHWATRLVAHWAPAHVYELGDYVPHASWRVFAFALATAVGVMLLAGVWPALRAAAVPPAEPLKDGAGSTRRRRERWSGLVVGEVALSTMLLMMAALLVMQNWTLARFEFGFDARRLLYAGIDYRRLGAMPAARSAALREEVLARLRTVPGVREVATVHGGSPMGGVVLGENGAAGERWINLRDHRVVSPSYLRAMGIPVLQGRDFADGDASGREPVAIVDRAAARRLWPEFASPVGRMVKLGTRESDAPWIRVVGVTQPLGRRPDKAFWQPDEPEIFVVDPADSLAPMSVVVATRTDDAALPLAVRRELRRTVGDRASVSVEPYTAQYDSNVRWLGFLAMLFCALSAFALVLCAVGLYGVLAYAVTQRSREFAIRIALGARAPTVARLVLRDASVMALAGVGIGAVGALAATYGMAADLLSIPFAHAKALVTAEAVLLAVAAAAAWHPVRRGTRADPSAMLHAN